jgi:uncharacterized protein (DUF2267 family)
MNLESQQEAFVVARAVLGALRDRLTVAETAQFAAQLPMLLQGVYYHEWTPRDKPEKIRSREEFLEKISEKLMGRHEPESAAQAVFAVLEEKMPGGELEDVRRILPEPIREIWP